jgi:hypothetical protein
MSSSTEPREPTGNRDSGPDYAIEALRTATEARAATPPGSDAASLEARGYQLPGLDFRFSSPSFLSAESRWVLFIVLAAGGFVALFVGYRITVDVPADDVAWPAAVMSLIVAAVAFALAYATVMGFASVELKTTIGEAAPGAEGGALTVTATVPADKATGIGRNVQVEATFSAPVDPATVTGANVMLKRVSGQAVAAAVSLDADGTTVRLRPQANLAANTAYEATIAKAVKSKDGKQLAADETWSFTTGP